MKSAYPYSNKPPTQFLAKSNVKSRTASGILMDQRAAQGVTRKEQIHNLSQNTLQLDELRDTGYHYNLMVAPNAFTSLSTKMTHVPLSEAERDAVFLQQTPIDTQKDKLSGFLVGGGSSEGAMDVE